MSGRRPKTIRKLPMGESQNSLFIFAFLSPDLKLESLRPGDDFLAVVRAVFSGDAQVISGAI